VVLLCEGMSKDFKDLELHFYFDTFSRFLGYGRTQLGIWGVNNLSYMQQQAKTCVGLNVEQADPFAQKNEKWVAASCRMRNLHGTRFATHY